MSVHHFPELQGLHSALDNFEAGAARTSELAFSAESLMEQIASDVARDAEQQGCTGPSAADHSALEEEAGRRKSPCHLDKFVRLKANLEQNRVFFGTRDLTTLLQEMITVYNEGPHQEEASVIATAIEMYVVRTFQEIQTKCQDQVLSTDNMRCDITAKLDRVRHQSERLDRPDEANRVEVEDARVAHIREAWDLHRQRATIAQEPNTVPALLKKRFDKFSAEFERHKQSVAAEEQRHAEEAQRLQQLHRSQGELLSREVEECHRRRECAEREERVLAGDRQKTIATIRKQLEHLGTLLERSREQRVAKDQARAREQELRNYMHERLARVSNMAGIHQELRHRFGAGRSFLLKFESWLKHSYDCFEQIVEEKRDQLAAELPREKNLFVELLNSLREDYDRRIKENEWAAKETEIARSKAEIKAARHQRDPWGAKKAEKQANKASECREALERLTDKHQDFLREKSEVVGLLTMVQRDLGSEGLAMQRVHQAEHRELVRGVLYNNQKLPSAKPPFELAPAQSTWAGGIKRMASVAFSTAIESATRPIKRLRGKQSPQEFVGRCRGSAGGRSAIGV